MKVYQKEVDRLLLENQEKIQAKTMMSVVFVVGLMPLYSIMHVYIFRFCSFVFDNQNLFIVHCLIFDKKLKNIPS